MPLRIKCRHCGKPFSVWEDLVGKKVQCPKCKASMVVPSGKLAADSSQASNVRSQRSAGPRHPKQEDSTTGPRRTLKVTPGARPTARPAAKNSVPTVPPATISKSQKKKAVPAPAKTRECTNCGELIPENEDLCDACGYHRILKKVLDTSDIKRADSSTGLERFLRNQVDDLETAESAWLWAKIVAAFFVVFFSAMCLGMLGLVVSIVAVIGLALYLRAWRKNHPEATTISEDPLSRLIWFGVLFVQRGLGWRFPQWPFPKARVLSLRDPKLDDDALFDLENLDEVDVIDLEGTAITNEGVLELADCKQLRFLVVRRTQVTAEAARKLQTALPKLWIWY
jgi:hypothetical protein